MRICLATLRQEFRNSGEIESIINLQGYLRGRGVDADILTPKGSYADFMPRSKSGLYWSKGADLWRLYRILRRHSGDYDVIHLFLPFPSLSFYGDFIKQRLGKKIVVTFESCMVELSGAGMASFLRYAPFSNLLRACINNKLLAKLSVHGADAYIVSSSYQKEQLSSAKMHVIPNLTSTKKYRKIDKLIARKRLGFPDDVILISYAGHFLAYKGINDLMTAFAELSAGDESIRLALAFSGIGCLDKAKTLARKLDIEKRVFFLGSVNISDFLSASDMLVVPYHYSFGTNWIPSILLEGFATEVPIVTADLLPLRELNEGGEVLLFAKAGNHRHLASVISLLMKDRERLEEMVRNQRRLMYTTLNPDVLIERYVEIYETVLK